MICDRFCSLMQTWKYWLYNNKTHLQYFPMKKPRHIPRAHNRYHLFVISVCLSSAINLSSQIKMINLFSEYFCDYSKPELASLALKWESVLFIILIGFLIRFLWCSIFIYVDCTYICNKTGDWMLPVQYMTWITRGILSQAKIGLLNQNLPNSWLWHCY